MSVKLSPLLVMKAASPGINDDVSKDKAFPPSRLIYEAALKGPRHVVSDLSGLSCLPGCFGGTEPRLALQEACGWLACAVDIKLHGSLLSPSWVQLGYG